MGLVNLSEIEPRVAQTHICRVVFLRIFEMALPPDIIPVRLGEQECILEIVEILL